MFLADVQTSYVSIISDGKDNMPQFQQAEAKRLCQMAKSRGIIIQFTSDDDGVKSMGTTLGLLSSSTTKDSVTTNNVTTPSNDLGWASTTLGSRGFIQYTLVGKVSGYGGSCMRKGSGYICTD